MVMVTVCNMEVAKEVAVWVQGLPEGHTEACYPVLRPGVDSHRGPPLKDSDADKREVCLSSAHHTCTLHPSTCLHS